MHSEYVQIRVLLESIGAVLRKMTPQPTSMEPPLSTVDSDILDSKFTFPLESCDQLRDFDDCLKTNAFYRQHLIEKFGKILGSDGMKKGDHAAPILAKILMASKLLPLTSWTGTSRTVGVKKKVPFQTFESIISLFYETIQRADSRWTLMDNTNYFKDKLLKHANARSLAHETKQKSKAEQLNVSQTQSDASN